MKINKSASIALITILSALTTSVNSSPLTPVGFSGSIAYSSDHTNTFYFEEKDNFRLDFYSKTEYSMADLDNLLNKDTSVNKSITEYETYFVFKHQLTSHNRIAFN
jgi:hypothetical protein